MKRLLLILNLETMKKILILLCLPLMTLAQQTYVPDDNFEAYLEANGMGDGIALNDSVFTSAIDTVAYLDLSNKNISDLNIQRLYHNNNYLSLLIDKACRHYACKLSFNLKFLFTMIALAAINMRFNDHRNTKHARQTCPLYKDNILISFCNLFIEKGAS